MNQLDLEVKRFKGKGHSKTKYCQISTLGSISYKLLIGIYIYNLGAVGGKDELAGF